MKKICDCGKLAVWLYAPDSKYVACDECVPRGCSCNRDLKEGIDYESPEAALSENWIEQVGEDGRKFPCCEWFFDADGWEIYDTGVEALQKSFERSLQDEQVQPREDTGDAPFRLTQPSTIPPWA